MPLLIVVLVAIAVAGAWLKRPAEAHVLACADPLAGCTFSHRGASAKLQFGTLPTPLEAFDLNMYAPDARQINVAFQMKGMDMGFNRYDLRPSDAGVFSAKIILPMCIRGRHDWTMVIDIDGLHYALPFRTQ